MYIHLRPPSDPLQGQTVVIEFEVLGASAPAAGSVQLLVPETDCSAETGGVGGAVSIPAPDANQTILATVEDCLPCGVNLFPGVCGIGREPVVPVNGQTAAPTGDVVSTFQLRSASASGGQVGAGCSGYASSPGVDCRPANG
eukprot:5939822-Pyramimonas_sp.AAC.2